MEVEPQSNPRRIRFIFIRVREPMEKVFLNNSELKNYFLAQKKKNIKTLEKYIDINEKKKIEIKSLRKEKSLFFRHIHILTKLIQINLKELMNRERK